MKRDFLSLVERCDRHAGMQKHLHKFGIVVAHEDVQRGVERAGVDLEGLPWVVL